MKKVAIIGVGPMGIYTFHALLQAAQPLHITLYEKASQAGFGMPYRDDENSYLMLANIASIEIPPLTESYLAWLQRQDASMLAQYGVQKSELHERQFLPRILLGRYFRAQFTALLEQSAHTCVQAALHEHSAVTDIEATAHGVRLWVNGREQPELYDYVIVATGHVWPEKTHDDRYYPSPWCGLGRHIIPPCHVGIMGTSLSAMDAAMAVVAQHGAFHQHANGELSYALAAESRSLSVTLMSRSAILPEVDFYCPIPYQPLEIATHDAISREIEAGSHGLLERVFELMRDEISRADPCWSAQIALQNCDVDNVAQAYFAARMCHPPFEWAKRNLYEAEQNYRTRHTISWRYAILRLHEVVERIVPHLEARDRERFDNGLRRVFVDSYAAIPPHSIRRLLALHEAGVLNVLKLGQDYRMERGENGTSIFVGEKRYDYEVFIDARGQKALKIGDLPFATLRHQVLARTEALLPLDADYFLTAPCYERGKIALAAIPYLLHKQPFVQGITACANIGRTLAESINASPNGKA